MGAPMRKHTITCRKLILCFGNHCFRNRCFEEELYQACLHVMAVEVFRKCVDKRVGNLGTLMFSHTPKVIMREETVAAP